jgi:hypothetical protein
MKKVTINDMVEKAREILFFDCEEKESILFLLKLDLEYFLKNFGYRGFKELKENLENLRETALERNNLKMVRVYCILLYLLNNLEDYYFSKMFNEFFEI